MILEYHRPETLTEALQLLDRPSPHTIPIGGGTTAIHHEGDVAVVDLQRLGWNQLLIGDEVVQAGSMVRLSQLQKITSFASWLPSEAPANLQNTASIGGALIRADGRSVLATVLMALDAQLIWEPGSYSISIGDWLAQRRIFKSARLIREVKWNARIDYKLETIARSPLDTPTVIVVAAKWASGRTRVVVGGFGDTPVLAMDGPSSLGAALAVKNAFLESTDLWATAEYRSEAGSILVNRLLA